MAGKARYFFKTMTIEHDSGIDRIRVLGMFSVPLNFFNGASPYKNSNPKTANSIQDNKLKDQVDYTDGSYFNFHFVK